MMIKKTQVLVIGAGPGGYPAAIRAAQLGKQVTVVERQYTGGVCLNVGCIPSKAIITAAKRWDAVQYPWKRGIVARDAQFDADLMHEEIMNEITGLRTGVRGLLAKNGCDYVSGTAQFVGPHNVKITSGDENEYIEFEHCIIATGSRPIELPNFPFGENVIDSTGCIHLTKVPEHLVVIGGGVIGLELGTAWMQLGAKLTVIEIQNQLLPGVPADLVTVVERKLKKRGATIYTRSRAVNQDVGRVVSRINVETPEGLCVIDDCSHVLVCVGRKPNTDTLNLEAAGVATDTRGFITIDQHCRTSVSHIFAVGDTVPGPMLAHKATNDGEVAAINTLQNKGMLPGIAARQTTIIPSVIFTDPEIATVGRTDDEVEMETDFPPLIGTFPFSASGRAVAAGETDGFCRVVLDASTSYYYIAGVQIVGAHAGEMIGEAAALLHGGQTRASDIMDTVHAHPTFSETLVEAVRVAVGEPLHLPPRKK